MRVTIRNLIIEKYASLTQEATIDLGSEWVIEDCEVRLNHFAGIGAAPARLRGAITSTTMGPRAFRAPETTFSWLTTRSPTTDLPGTTRSGARGDRNGSGRSGWSFGTTSHITIPALASGPTSTTFTPPTSATASKTTSGAVSSTRSLRRDDSRKHRPPKRHRQGLAVLDDGRGHRNRLVAERRGLWQYRGRQLAGHHRPQRLSRRWERWTVGHHEPERSPQHYSFSRDRRRRWTNGACRYEGECFISARSEQSIPSEHIFAGIEAHVFPVDGQRAGRCGVATISARHGRCFSALRRVAVPGRRRA